MNKKLHRKPGPARTDGQLQQRACIALCTAKRPKMLQRCLSSIADLEIPEGWKLMLVVCENTEKPECRDQVDAFAGTVPFDVRYLHEPKTGIPIARNRTLEAALDLGSNWILFLDDDEVAEATWLTAFANAASAYGVEIYRGPVIRDYPDGTPDWYPRKSVMVGQSGEPVSRVFTSNTMMNATIASSQGLSLRFDESLRYTGGSDLDYFERAMSQGMRAVAVPDAIVRELVPAERVTLGWHLGRVQRKATNNTRSRIGKNGKGLEIFKFAIELIPAIFSILFDTLRLLLSAVFSPGSAKSKAVSVLRKLARLSGRARALVGISPQPYRKIQGE